MILDGNLRIAKARADVIQRPEESGQRTAESPCPDIPGTMDVAHHEQVSEFEADGSPEQSPVSATGRCRLEHLCKKARGNRGTRTFILETKVNVAVVEQ